MIGPFGTRYFWLIAVTAIITIAQMTLMEMGYDIEAFFYLWLSQVFAPAFITALVIAVLILSKRRTSNKLIFSTYFTIWLIQIAISFIVIFTGTYTTYI